jgi:hypothetical protein
MRPVKQPQTDDEWTTHVLNIHGTFFQQWCMDTVKQSPPWVLKASDYPVAYPPLPHRLESKESALDVMAQFQAGDKFITLLIECKKNNPDLSRWIFFPLDSAANDQAMKYRQFNMLGGDGTHIWRSQSSLASFATIRGRLCADPREVKAKYQGQQTNTNTTKTSNAAIGEAARQIALATQAIVAEEDKRLEDLSMASPTWPYERGIYADTYTSQY